MVSWSRSDAFERLSVSATTGRWAWDGTRAGALARLDERQAIDGESSRAFLGIDWQRDTAASRWQAGAFARQAQSTLFSGSAEAGLHAGQLEQRDRTGSVGSVLRWMSHGFSVSAQARGDSMDSDGRLRGDSGRAFGTWREDHLRQSGLGLDAQLERRVLPGLVATFGARVEDIRYAVRSDLDTHSGAGSEVLLLPRMSWVASLAPGMKAFLTYGSASGERLPGAALDPRNGAPLGFLDPLATARTLEAGWRQSFGALETTLSASRTALRESVRLLANGGVARDGVPAERGELRLETRYDAFEWLRLDFAGTLARKRGGAEHDGHERYAVAGATLRPSRGWTASLFVSHYDAAPAEDETPQRATSLVSARLTHVLSRETRMTLDVFNLFDQPARAVDYFAGARLWGGSPLADDAAFRPAEPRGVRFQLHTTF